MMRCIISSCHEYDKIEKSPSTIQSDLNKHSEKTVTQGSKQNRVLAYLSRIKIFLPNILMKLNSDMTVQNTENEKNAADFSKFIIGLHNLSVGVICADCDRKITYINKAALLLLSKAELDIQIDLPNFSAENLIGKSIDLFHKNPQHQANLLRELNGMIESISLIGGHQLLIRASPIINELGQRIGSLAEVTDIFEINKKATELVIATNKGLEESANSETLTNHLLTLENAEKKAWLSEFVLMNSERIFQSTEKEARITALIDANKELELQNFQLEKELRKSIALGEKLTVIYEEFATVNEELIVQNAEKAARAAELITANKELAFQNSEKEKRAAEFVIVNNELELQNFEKEERANELMLVNEELILQYAEKDKRSEELIQANNELARANEEIAVNLHALFSLNEIQTKQAEELTLKNQELIRQAKKLSVLNEDLAIANEELMLQTVETEKRATELTRSYDENAVLIDQMNHMQKLESIGRLTSGIAHDFNNILACMLGYNEMNKDVSDDLTGKGVDGLKTELENNTKQIDEAGKRAMSLISKMMAYCRQENSAKKIDIKPTQEVINEVLAMLRPSLTSRIKLEFTNPCQINHNDCETCVVRDICEDNIQIDAIDLHQILTNLAVNARDAMKERGGIISISLDKLHFENHICRACSDIMGGDFIVLSVSDNGTGIEEGVIKRMFDPFFTTKEQGEGTGLGLSTVSGMVHSSGGHILVDSTLGQGTAFKLLFPIRPKVLID